MPYSIDSSSDHCYPGTSCLINKFIAVFKIKSHIHMNETTLNSQKGKHSERRVESHSEEHPVTLP